MLKFLACLLTIVAVVGGVLCQQTLLPGDGSVDVWHVLAHDDVVNEKVISYQQFQAVMQATLDDLGTGAIRLEGAAARPRCGGSISRITLGSGPGFQSGPHDPQRGPQHSGTYVRS